MSAAITLSSAPQGASARWQLPMLDKAATVALPEATPSEAELSAAQLFVAQHELTQLQGSIAQRHEAAAAEGRAHGYDEGMAAGRAAAALELKQQQADIAEQWSQLLAGVQQRLGCLDRALDDAVHDLVVQLGATVLRAELAINGAPLRRMIEEAMSGLRDDLQGATLVLHPDDLKLLGDPGLPTRADASIGRGELRIHTALGDIEASLRTRIEHALQLLQRDSR